MKNKNNPVPKIVFTDPKTNKNISLAFIIFGMLLTVILAIFITEDKIAEYLKLLSELNINILLALAALVISVFQFEKKFFKTPNSKENQQKLVKSYIFNIFTIITISASSYLIALLYELNVFKEFPFWMFRAWLAISGLIIFLIIANCLSTLVAFLNIE